MFRQQDLARLIKDHGESLVLITDAENGTYNPDTGELEGGADDPDVSFTGYIYNQDIGLPTDGTTVKSEKRCAISGSMIDTTPTDRHKISRGSSVYDITNVEEIRSKGVVICYICWLSN